MMSRASVILQFSSANYDCHQQLDKFERRGGSRLQKLTGSGTGAAVTAYVSEDINPPVYYTRRSNGSFAIVDGEIYHMDGAPNSKRCENQSAWVLDAYDKSGAEAFERIDMAASLVLWDAVSEVLYVVRDRSGIVPSFYQYDGGVFIWASDIWTLMRLSGSVQFDYTAIDFFLANGFVIAPWSLIKGIEKISPAHALSCTRTGGVELKRYWPKADKQESKPSLPEWTEAMTESFGKALQRRRNPCGSSAAFLSGGMDSALVVSGLRKLLDSEVDTFTIGYESYQGRNDERARARTISQTLGTHHHEITFGPQDIIDGHESMVIAHGAPFAWGLRAFFIQPIADAGFQAILGGDPPESCYPKQIDLASMSLGRIPRSIRNAAAPALLTLLRAYKPDLARKVTALHWSADNGLPGRYAGSIIPCYIRKSLYDDGSFAQQAHQYALELMQTHKLEYSDWGMVDQRIYQHLRYFVAEHTLAFNHWWTTWHGIKYRAPFCDYELLDIMLSLPRTTSDKVHLRYFAQSLLPANVANEPKNKTGVPIHVWLRGPLRDFSCDLLSSNEIGRLNILHADGVRTLLTQHLKGQGNHGIALWAVITLVVWARLVQELD